MNIDTLIGRYAVGSNFSAISQFFLSQNRLKTKGILVDIYYVETHVSFAQIYPYIYYRKQISETYGATIRFFPTNRFMDVAKTVSPSADIALLQTVHGIDEQKILNFVERLRNKENTKLSYIDSFAHNDLRLSKLLNEYINYYIKKSIFTNKNQYFKSYNGDTNLTEYYSTLYDIKLKKTNFHSPRAVLEKIRKAPGFFMSPRFIENFSQENPAFLGKRDINLHARFGAARPHEWYNAMRQDLLDRTLALNCPRTVAGTGVRRRQYMNELKRSKICISPFGYGELCWRDVEAFQTGAVLVKPDMSHLETLPDLYVPYETYVPISWDFSDLEEAVELVLGDDDLRERLAYNAYKRIHDYIKEEKFVDDISFVFQ